MPESSWRKYQRDPCGEQARIARQSKAAKAERILHAVTLDPELTMDFLEERFGWLPDAIADTLHRAGFRWNNSQWVRR